MSEQDFSTAPSMRALVLTDDFGETVVDQMKDGDASLSLNPLCRSASSPLASRFVDDIETVSMNGIRAAYHIDNFTSGRILRTENDKTGCGKRLGASSDIFVVLFVLSLLPVSCKQLHLP